MKQSNSHENNFLDSVCSLIKSKGARKTIRRELQDHINDQKQAYILKGFSEEEATIKAVNEMGDPLEVGKELNKTHKPIIEWSVLIVIAVFTVISGVMQYIITVSGTNLGLDYSMLVFKKFLMYAPVAIIIFFIAYFFDYTLIKKYTWGFYISYLILMVTIAITSPKIYGISYYLTYPSFLFVPIYAGLVYRFREKGYIGILLSGIICIPTFIITIRYSTIYGTLIIAFSCLAILTTAIIKGYFNCNTKKSLGLVYIPTVITALLGISFLNSYQTARLTHLITQNADPQGMGYITNTIRTIVSKAKPFGETFILNKPIERVLPDWHTDFSFTFLIGKLGYVPAIMVSALMLFLLYKLYKITIKQRNNFGQLVSLGGICIITMQFVLSILPNIGIYTLLADVPPFIAYGFTNFALIMGLLGLILSVHRRTNIADENLPDSQDESSFITFKNGKLLIDFSNVIPKKS